MAMPTRGGVITCNIDSVDTLYQSYLPFINNGAIFVPTSRKYKLGEEVFVAFTLPQHSERFPLSGKVVWLNNKNTSAKPAGFAISFGKDATSGRMRDEIEKLLAGKLENDAPTYTI